ncbi:hypothetical protein DESME_12255 [Desulfitobacterium metallireducens DSM 15288]|uniref:YggT family protein n=1 Tax=Desulfitobacterium metallireducens DSM 15288 TaxID=871968 RepID=W0EA37_9FIRM|nr:hypothetical protein DESME_12255 [Desulfitobacterium metallireducens DSM 15288]
MSILVFVYSVIDKVLMLLGYAIVLEALMSWVPQLSNSKFGSILYDITEPLLRPFRRFQIGGAGFGIDLSPIIAYFSIYLIRVIVLPLIFGLLQELGL